MCSRLVASGRQSRAHRRSRSELREHQSHADGHRAWQAESAARSTPIPRPSRRSDTEVHCAKPHGGVLDSTSAPPSNQAPSTESQPTPSIQQLLGSALRSFGAFSIRRSKMYPGQKPLPNGGGWLPDSTDGRTKISAQKKKVVKKAKSASVKKKRARSETPKLSKVQRRMQRWDAETTSRRNNRRREALPTIKKRKRRTPVVGHLKSKEGP